jgi:hypothetical protein
MASTTRDHRHTGLHFDDSRRREIASSSAKNLVKPQSLHTTIENRALLNLLPNPGK